MDVILLLADPPALLDLDSFGPADDVARRQILLSRRIFWHEALAFAVGQIAAFAAGAFGDQNADAVDAGGMELNEFHILQRQAGTQHHRAPVTGAGVRRGAGLIDAAAPAGRNDRHVGAEAMDRSVFKTPGEQTPADTVVVHQQVKCEILNEEAGLVLQALGRACAGWRGRCDQPRRRPGKPCRPWHNP